MVQFCCFFFGGTFTKCHVIYKINYRQALINAEFSAQKLLVFELLPR